MSLRQTPHVRIPSALQFCEDLGEPDPKTGKVSRVLSRGARDLWPVLDDLAREHAGVRITGPELCTILGCSPASLRRWRGELEAAGWLRYEAAPGRSRASLWVPLRRARRVRSLAVAEPVDNSAGTPCDEPETRSRRAGSDHGNPLTKTRFRPRASSTAGAREEEQPRPAGDVDLRWSHSTPWCGQCDAPDYRWAESLQEPGKYVRCPACHPDTEPAF